MEISISNYVVRSSNGGIDHEATLAKFANDLLTFEVEQEQEASVIGAAIHALFDKNLGKRITTPCVISAALTALNVQPENYNTLSAKVKAFLKTSPEFDVAKAVGVGRVRDLP